jgi:hypothetical protein
MELHIGAKLDHEGKIDKFNYRIKFESISFDLTIYVKEKFKEKFNIFDKEYTKKIIILSYFKVKINYINDI